MAVYLIHFDKPYKHAAHYLGYADDVAKREKRHRAGQGARLLRVVSAAGIGWHIVRVAPDGDKELERKLKKNSHARLLCPVCNPPADGKGVHDGMGNKLDQRVPRQGEPAETQGVSIDRDG